MQHAGALTGFLAIHRKDEKRREDNPPAALLLPVR
jgi:hypothetical protein